MLREVHARGAEALARLRMLIGAGLVGAAVTLCANFRLLGSYALPFSIKGFSARSLSMTLNPTLLPLGIGGLMMSCSYLAVLFADCEPPGHIRPDNGPELTANAVRELFPRIGV